MTDSKHDMRPVPMNIRQRYLELQDERDALLKQVDEQQKEMAKLTGSVGIWKHEAEVLQAAVDQVRAALKRLDGT